MLSVLLLAADGATGSGGADPGEAASAWDVGGLLFWSLVVVVAGGVLAGVLVLAARRRRAPVATTDGADDSGAPAAQHAQHAEPQEGWELAVLTFDGRTGAERAFAGVRGIAHGASWT